MSEVLCDVSPIPTTRGGSCLQQHSRPCDTFAQVSASFIPQPAQCFHELILVVEDLLKRIADTDDADLRRRRVQVRNEMLALQHTLGFSIDAAR
jgi:hypothetical protein